jgi:mono/diheme cytochrome c family protein
MSGHKQFQTPRLARQLILAAAGAVVVTAGLAFFYLYPETLRTPEIAGGQKLYSAHCASCHGAKLEGEPNWQSPKPNGRMPAPPHDENGHTWHHSDRELLLITKKSLSAIVPGYTSDMPAFENVLSDDEIAQILAYIKSKWPDEARRYQQERTRLQP